jgi:hypothetical protein
MYSMRQRTQHSPLDRAIGLSLSVRLSVSLSL